MFRDCIIQKDIRTQTRKVEVYLFARLYATQSNQIKLVYFGAK